MISFNFKNVGQYKETNIDMDHVGVENLGLLDKQDLSELLCDLVNAAEDLFYHVHGIDINKFMNEELNEDN